MKRYRVAGGTFDLGIVNHAPAHSRLEDVLAGRQRLCLVLPSDADLSPDFSGLQDRGFIAHPDGFAFADELLGLNLPDAYRAAELLRLRSYVNQIGQIAEPVACGLGYTILPWSGIAACAQRDRLAVAQLARQVQHDLWIVQRKERVLPARIRTVQSVIMKAVAPI
ncbi:LysR substrate-binding domain-containing protein [Labrenzia sp. 011]|uniref:LysR substrate-binding domain-containing protein n=1 Tax=Labrenzia sp. 011 TaxID=2171494 RepID=UPI001403D1B2|nr:LysR substrate-binding domain-containing protein [Labrenzia sp. 011]